MCVTTNGVWNGNRIYWTLAHSSRLHFTHTHTHTRARARAHTHTHEQTLVSSATVITSFLVMASIDVRSPFTEFPNRPSVLATAILSSLEVEVTLRLTVSQYVLVSSTLVGLATRFYFLSEGCCLIFAALFLWGTLSDERTGL
jgi:hypothetical protein